MSRSKKDDADERRQLGNAADLEPGFQVGEESRGEPEPGEPHPSAVRAAKKAKQKTEAERVAQELEEMKESEYFQTISAVGPYPAGRRHLHRSKLEALGADLDWLISQQAITTDREPPEDWVEPIEPPLVRPTTHESATARPTLAGR